MPDELKPSTTIIIEIELNEFELPNTMIAKGMAERDLGRKLSFSDLFRVFTGHYIRHRNNAKIGAKSENTANGRGP